MKRLIVSVLLATVMASTHGQGSQSKSQDKVGKRRCRVVLAVDLGTFVSARRLHVAMNYRRIGLLEYMDSFARVVADGRDRIRKLKEELDSVSASENLQIDVFFSECPEASKSLPAGDIDVVVFYGPRYKEEAAFWERKQALFWRGEEVSYSDGAERRYVVRARSPVIPAMKITREMLTAEDILKAVRLWRERL